MDVQKSNPLALCAICKGELYEFDTVFAFEGYLVCQDCLEDFAKKLCTKITLERVDFYAKPHY